MTVKALVLLRVGDQEFAGTTSTAGRPENHGVRDVVAVKVQAVRSALIRLQHREARCPEHVIDWPAAVDREEERQIRVVGVQHIHRPQVAVSPTGHRRQPGIEQVVAFVSERRVMGAVPHTGRHAR
jgi:hypothetical protein